MEYWLGMPETWIAQMQASRPFFFLFKVVGDSISNKQINKQNKTRLILECLKEETQGK